MAETILLFWQFANALFGNTRMFAAHEDPFLRVHANKISASGRIKMCLCPAFSPDSR